VAATAASQSPAVTNYLRFLQTQAAKAIFEKFGFSFLVPPKAS
jgi:ABC-type molybdate transport system substrate-binding protein